MHFPHTGQSVKHRVTTKSMQKSQQGVDQKLHGTRTEEGKEIDPVLPCLYPGWCLKLYKAIYKGKTIKGRKF